MMEFEPLTNDVDHVCNPNFDNHILNTEIINGTEVHYRKHHRLQQALDVMCQSNEVVDGIEAQLLLREIYQSTMGIFDHTTNHSRPMALMAMHHNESTMETSRRSRRMIQFDESKIYQRFGISWERFENMPLYQADMLLRTSMERERMAAENQASGIPTDSPPIVVEKK